MGVISVKKDDLEREEAVNEAIRHAIANAALEGIKVDFNQVKTLMSKDVENKGAE
jgi:ribosomal protein S5